MRLYPIVVISITTLLSCSPQTSEEQSSIDSLRKTEDTTAVADVVAVQQTKISIDPVYEDSLKRFFTPEQLDLIKKARIQFNNIKTSTDMAEYFRNTINKVTDILNKQVDVITPTETSGDNSPAASWSWFSDYYPGFSGSADCSECSFTMKTGLGELQEKASATEGMEDDAFFDLCNSVYGGGYVELFNVGWWYELIGCDFCAASIFGNGQRLEILRKIEKIDGNTKAMFAPEIEHFQEAATSEAFPERYAKSKKEILDELNAILEISILTSTQRDRLMSLKKDIEADKPQFDCNTRDCEWPSY